MSGKKTETSPDKHVDKTVGPPRTWLAALVALGAFSALWALFQWGELIAARAGATPFCALGGNFDCGAVWDSAFARGVHNTTRVPVAGWGLMWGLVAFVLPLVALTDDRRLGTGLSAALRLTAIAGVVSVLGLFVSTLLTGAFCIGCIGTYLVVLTWSVLAWLSTRATGFAEAPRGVMWAGGLVALSYALLFIPGTRTPHAVVDAGKDAMKAVVDNMGGPTKQPAVPQPTAPQQSLRFDGPSTGDPARDQALEQFIAGLDAQALQAISDVLLQVEDAKVRTDLPTARAVIGLPNAPVRLIDFTDPLCGHCAGLHGVLEEISRLVPAGTFSMEPHFYPLDGTCNPSVERKWDTDIRCQAVRAQLCFEDDPNKLAAAQRLIFENQQGLTKEKMFELLKGFADKKTLEACMASEATQKKLVSDIEAGNKLGLEGTPLLYMNGRLVPPFPPVVFALILTHGATKHPAFKALPAPKPPSADAHAGHQH